MLSDEEVKAAPDNIKLADVRLKKANMYKYTMSVSPLDCMGCGECITVCPADAIEYTQTETTRTIWNREFELVFCEECGALMGTPESIRHAAGNGDVPRICDACRKKRLADEMMQTYRYV